MIPEKNNQQKKQSFLGTYLVMFVLFLLVLLTGYNYFFQPFADLQFEEVVQEATLVNQVDSEESIQEIDSMQQVVNSLSSEEKISLLIAQPANLSADQEFKTLNTGYITLFGSELEKDTVLFFVTQLLQQRSSKQLKLGIMVDHEGGEVQRLAGDGFTPLPSWKELCDSPPSEGLVWFSTSAEELKEVGITHVLAPIVDVGGSAVLGSRLCSSEYDIVIAASSAYAESFFVQGITPVFKHFPGIGSVARDLHTDSATVTVLEKDAEPFRKLLSDFPKAGVMTTHIGVTNQDSSIPCTFSSDCVGEIISLYPDTLRFTDALEMKSSLFHASASASLSELSDVSQKAVLAGNNVLVYGPSVTVEELVRVREELVQLYESSDDFKVKVDESVELVVKSKLEE